ncbi:DUF6377 domain-containing protein [Aureibacter tunicatorum]|uniref:DUF6377 domain-containing protein n=1 Tax=Aureibacter tunicatorum TaxID=866807 RepID=A0AAE3XU85_9BACT|nr:DUF6377 domain-containing protein [Aureibacter tunicatorum]MDR6241981.1 hypothetical protein [Aureibacter tunicatorum]BDD07286.1 hypothetical protein AUTU_47690 [Aureibacter tunicatorum]
MNKLFFIISFLISSQVFAQNSDSYLKQLDHEIALRDNYSQIREQRITILKTLLSEANNNKEKYAVQKQLYDQYAPYQADSAFYYANQCVKTAQKESDENLIIQSKIQLIHAYILVGAYVDASNACKKLKNNISTPSQLYSYYELQRILYANLSMYQFPAPIMQKYNKLKNAYLDSLLSQKKNDQWYQLLKSEKLIEEGDNQQAIALLESSLKHMNINDREFAFFAYVLSHAYENVNQTDEQMKFLCLSAITDIKSAVKENAALRELALLLYKNGDIDKAYSYIKIALEDANFSQAKLRSFEVWEVMPLINQAYQIAQTNKQRNLYYFAVIASCLVFILILSVIMIRKQSRKIQNANIQIKENNQNLRTLNEQLQSSKLHIEEINDKLLASNQLRKSYIAKYLGLCSSYIAKMNLYRTRLLRKASTSSKDSLLTILKSKDIIDEELKHFYKDFDEAFLGLYPTFVEEFNLLLKPEEKLIPKKGELLNTELRIFALVRIGISESAQIAEFLRYSPNTIYNYKAKVKNKSKTQREDFEKEVMNIGSIDKIEK